MSSGSGSRAAVTGVVDSKGDGGSIDIVVGGKIGVDIGYGLN